MSEKKIEEVRMRIPQKRQKAHVFQDELKLNALLEEGWIIEAVHRLPNENALIILWTQN